MNSQQHLLQAFQDQFNALPTFMVQAPGRVNLIGEHTDYNDGFCLPMAIDRAVTIALRPRPDKQIILHSLNFDETISFSLTDLTRTNKGWHQYVEGVAWALQQNGHPLAGWEGVLMGTVPLGSGLSSSAALEMALTRAFAAVTPFPWHPVPMAQIGQQVENGWLHLQTGILDQLISASGIAGHALLLDCRALSLTPIPFPNDVTIIIMDTKTPRGLVDSAYNQRRAECETAAHFFNVPALRDVSQADFDARAHHLDPIIRQRARHVITENARTQLAAQAMQAGDHSQLGHLMNASHDSLRDDYAVTSNTLNAMVDAARQQPGCFGARMTGGGFGGCAIALVSNPNTTAFITHVTQAYQNATNITPALYPCQPAAGARLLPPFW